jgi:hypothetical protein
VAAAFWLRSADQDIAHMQWDVGHRDSWRAAWEYRKASESLRTPNSITTDGQLQFEYPKFQ